MKVNGLIILLTLNLPVFGQIVSQEKSIEKIDKIFDDYINQKESTDSNDNKVEMELSLKFLQTKCDIKHFSRLIDVWMYYDPTDFPTRQLIKPILLLDKEQGLKAIEERIKKKKKWETQNTAPYSDLLLLRNEFKIK